MSRVAVVGCGVVGAAIAYELSQIPGLTITVFDRQLPAQAATGAALGVLMGIISHKVKGKAWQLRLASMQRYETLIPELEAIAGCNIPWNRNGILKLCFAEEDLAKWQTLAETRKSQGWLLEILDAAQLPNQYPYLNPDSISAAIYSPRDRQVDPVALTRALVTAAERNGVTFHFNAAVETITCSPGSNNSQTWSQLQTTAGNFEIDWLVVAAGLGSTPLTAALQQSIEIRPVLGQALHLELDQLLGILEKQPVITGNDVHIVPLGSNQCWVGATVEFAAGEEVVADEAQLQTVLKQAIAFCPALAKATVLKTWSGLRPRPEGRPAPIIGPLPGYSNVLLATGHYRNGVLLAPATAQMIRQLITAKQN
ncbi:FAD-binding oxidoreductase [Trichocoleus sp. FACHB-591]|uniref:NAD(P)/FAD-dependent oxidoreductase n=1 Tax=Trichocoleus sp. FACHB-591 TaxID=2692872 RepID=UPI001682CC73|nr:FAD-dependent oxidoreductase [Trichocoleus sp. FACHB-591]MBD2094894.1 FAD-binding oxidoreductase [Trichocoleus sp. FACHB-591]